MKYMHQERSKEGDIERHFYGTHEAQVSYGAEADLHRHFVGCTKNPGHTQFVPANDFNISHLPEGCHDKDIVEFIRSTAELTVRVDVKMTSTARPKFWPDTTIPYAFYNVRGSDVMRIGTGMVFRVSKHLTGICKCFKCQQSDSPSKVWGKVTIETACHVVFDDLEAKHAVCRLFYDTPYSPLVTLWEWSVVDVDLAADWCLLKCVTCDVDLVDKLIRSLENKIRFWRNVIIKYKGSQNVAKLCFIVSHPHGCPKQISIGHWIHRLDLKKTGFDRYGNRWKATKYTYTTCTCPGSSGAYVHFLSDSAHLHSGVNCEGTNFSSTGGEWFSRRRSYDVLCAHKFTKNNIVKQHQKSLLVQTTIRETNRVREILHGRL